MEHAKTLLLIPGIIYGVGLVDLLKVFRPKVYWEIRVLALLLFLTLIINWFLYAERLNASSLTLGIYVLTMLSPLLFTKACNLLTPQLNEVDTTTYFFAIRRPFFILLGFHTTVNILLQIIIYDDGFNVFRMIGISLLFACAFINKLWLRVIMMMTFAAIFAYIFTITEISI